MLLDKEMETVDNGENRKHPGKAKLPGTFGTVIESHDATSAATNTPRLRHTREPRPFPKSRAFACRGNTTLAPCGAPS